MIRKNKKLKDHEKRGEDEKRKEDEKQGEENEKRGENFLIFNQIYNESKPILSSPEA